MCPILSALFLILVGLKATVFSEKMLIYTRCICSFMSNLIKKSLKDSNLYLTRYFNQLFNLRVHDICGVYPENLSRDLSKMEP